MERLATDTAPRALTQRRTRLRSREKDGERGGREFGTARLATKRNAPRGERANRAAAGSEAGGDGTRRGKSAGRGAAPRAGMYTLRGARLAACVTGAARRESCRAPAGRCGGTRNNNAGTRPASVATYARSRVTAWRPDRG